MGRTEQVADRVGMLLDDGFSEVGDAETVFDNCCDERTRTFISGE